MADSEYFVMAGLAVFERQIHFLSETLDHLQEKYLPGTVEPVEFHAREILPGKQEPWASLTQGNRRALLEELYRIIAESNRQGVYLFGVAFHKPSRPDEDPVERALDELCHRFDLFLANKETGQDPLRGMLVVDRTHSDKDARIRQTRAGL